VIVEFEDKNLDTAYIEDFIKAAMLAANNRLTRQGRFPINPFIDQQMCWRGRAAVRCLFRVADGVLIPDISLWDSRFTYYEMGQDGLGWGAFEGYRTKDLILAEYPKANVKGKSGLVLDAWDKKINRVYVDGEKVKEQTNPYDYPPVVTQVVPMGSMLADDDEIKNRGESIFFLIRDLIPELNRLVSIMQSLNLKALDNALLWKTKDGAGQLPDYEKLTKPGSITKAEIGGGDEPVSYGELKREAYLLHQIIEQRIRWGTMEVVGVGDLPGPLSAVALIEIGEGRDQVFLPRLSARGLLKQQLADMIIDQVLKSGESSVEIGTRGHKRSFQTSKLKGEYEIQYKYFIKSPKVDVARFSMAAAAGDLIPDKAKRRDILQREDPEEDERQLRWEEAERLSPAVKIDRTIRGLLELAKRGDKSAELEAEMLSAEMGVSLKQMLEGNTSQVPKPEEAQKPQPLLPMFGGGGSSGRKPAQPIEEK